MSFIQKKFDKKKSQKLSNNYWEHKKYKYHAFISYAHEDKESVQWLYNLLLSYWVPWKGNRRIFLDTETIPAGGGLTSSIKQALEDSHYLIVCCSKSAVESPWVNLEVEEFLKTHSVRNILACMVGKLDEYVLPHFLTEIESQLNDSLFKPDLRGEITQLEKQELKKKTEDALALLASILNFKDKYEVINRVYRVRQVIIASLIGFISLSSGLYISWQEWLKTPQGLRNLAIDKMLTVAESEIIDDYQLIMTAKALGEQGRRQDLDKFVQVFTNNPDDPFFRSLAIAIGYASLPEPNCEIVDIELKKLSQNTARLWPEAFLTSQQYCGGNWLSFAHPESLDADKMLQWSEALAKTGHIDKAKSIVSLPDFPAQDKFTLEVFIGIASKEEISFTQESINDWVGENDCGEVLRDSLKLLREIDLANRLEDGAADILLDYGLYCTSKIDIEIVNYWNLFQELSARLAGANRNEDALTVLAIGENKNNERQNDPYFAPGWAWRSLAYHRLGEKSQALESFRLAESSGLAQPLMSRTWSEWDDIVLAYVMANDWKSAFKAAENPRDERVRFFLRAKLIELWSL